MRRILLALIAISTLSAQTAPQETPGVFRPKGATTRAAASLKDPKLASGPQVTNGASFFEGAAPGGLASLFTSNRLFTVNGSYFASSIPLPFRLNGIQVYVDRYPAPILAAAQDPQFGTQINFQVPFEVSGLERTNPNVVVYITDYNQNILLSVPTTLFTLDPGAFSFSTNEAVVVSNITNRVVSKQNPARRGDPVYAYATGLGGTTNQPQTGSAGPTREPLARTLANTFVFLDQAQAPVQYSGFAPGFVGVYQVNFVIPNDTPSGNRRLTIQQPTGDSRTPYVDTFDQNVTVAVQ